MERPRLFLILVLTSLLTLSACTSVEKLAYRTVVGAKAFLDNVKAQHLECVRGNSSHLCITLEMATSAKDSLTDAGEVYCGVATFGEGDKTPCSPPNKHTPAGQQMLTTLQNALANYEQLEKDLRGIVR